MAATKNHPYHILPPSIWPLAGSFSALALTGGAAARLDALTPPGMIAEIAVSLTDEPPIAHAIVIITARPL